MPPMMGGDAQEPDALTVSLWCIPVGWLDAQCIGKSCVCVLHVNTLCVGLDCAPPGYRAD